MKKNVATVIVATWIAGLFLVVMTQLIGVHRFLMAGTCLRSFNACFYVDVTAN